MYVKKTINQCSLGLCLYFSKSTFIPGLILFLIGSAFLLKRTGVAGSADYSDSSSESFYLSSSANIAIDSAIS